MRLQLNNYCNRSAQQELCHNSAASEPIRFQEIVMYLIIGQINHKIHLNHGKLSLMHLWQIVDIEFVTVRTSTTKTCAFHAAIKTQTYDRSTGHGIDQNSTGMTRL